MHLALEAAGVRAVTRSSRHPYTFAATAEVIRYFDAQPVFVDVDPADTHHRSGADRKAVTPRTRALMPVHLGGLPADMDADHGDGPRSGLPSSKMPPMRSPRPTAAEPIGSISEMTCFSFYATKTITTGEGGMIATDNDDWADRCRIMSLHGISSDAWKRYTSEGTWCYEIIAPGYKYNMTDVAAGMGRAQLRKAERMRDAPSRDRNAFSCGIRRSCEELQLPPDRSDCEHAWHLYMLRLHLDRLSIDRAQIHGRAEGTAHRCERPFYPPAYSSVLQGSLRLRTGGLPQWHTGSISERSRSRSIHGCRITTYNGSSMQ